MNEQHARLLEVLPDDTLREIATRRLCGESNDEIAAELGLSERSVERKQALIRERWQRKLNRLT